MSEGLSQEEIDWLNSLDKEIGERVKNSSTGVYHGLYFYRDKRKLTREELTRVVEILTKHKLPISISSGQFYFSVRIFNHPVYIGTDVPVVFFFQSNQFPAISPERDNRDKEACEFLWPYITASNNIVALERYKLELPKESPDYYF
ncbi:MAG: hypothetical protein U9M89_02050 [Patescibacteria group bacterium]|nr:hypothetical protein [Patescibacteria group bacterium]